VRWCTTDIQASEAPWSGIASLLAKESLHLPRLQQVVVEHRQDEAQSWYYVGADIVGFEYVHMYNNLKAPPDNEQLLKSPRK
jgi:hypothetical protein